jgi:hypothetical protein
VMRWEDVRHLYREHLMKLSLIVHPWPELFCLLFSIR